MQQIKLEVANTVFPQITERKAREVDETLLDHPLSKVKNSNNMDHVQKERLPYFMWVRSGLQGRR